ncbi:DUF2953 domain-containing protein [Priestia taiwanensis]|uniref:DUF2953 domain-containing protein n=1 Tax=Priestia taiwanensis TaxID=1347902 RepID=A0A917AUL2_9BACI|nr:DUF2953 domain-containing protein [Priestia taiwanensis]GGE77203.1 hypothetical protein GCM10007140_28550 [Priestia taiwanensis]
MYIALWIVGVILVVLLLLLIMKITIEVHAFYTEEEKQVYVYVYMLFGLIRISIDVLDELTNKNKAKNTGEEEKDDTEEIDKKAMLHSLIKSIGEIHTIVKKFLKRVTIRELTWHSSVGTGDAASTGMIAGICWTGKGWILGLMTSYFRVKDRIDMNVMPVFQGKGVRTEMKLRMSLRVWSVLICALSFLRYWRKQQVQYRALQEKHVEQGGIS